MNELDETALAYASDMAGEVLDELGETDLAKLSREQWLELLRVIICRYYDKLA